MKAAVVPSAGGEFVVEDQKVRAVGQDEVKIEVEACGYCHSDENIRQGWTGAHFPRVPGHEVVGRIKEVGPFVPDRFFIGQRVGIGWHGGNCGSCDSCIGGVPTGCSERQACGTSYDGGFASVVVAPHSSLARIPEGIEAIHAGPLMCAGITVWNALRNSGASWGDLVAIQGIGGLGHIAVQLAAAMGFEVAAITTNIKKEKEIRALGAHHVLSGEPNLVAASLMRLGGAKTILTTIPSGEKMNGLLPGLGRNGRLVVVGVSTEPLRVSPSDLLANQRGMQGSVIGSPLEIEKLLRFCVTHNIRPQVETWPLSKIHEAQKALLSGKIRFRAVLIP